jgi:hypothetical protein
MDIAHWLWEYDREGDCYTWPAPSVSAIAEVVNYFDGRSTFYCCLFDKTDESCLWCYGQPEQRIIEVRLVTEGVISHFVLRRQDSQNGPDITAQIAVQYGIEPDELLIVEAAELLTAAEALSVLLSFYHTKTIPTEFETVSKAYLFT